MAKKKVTSSNETPAAPKKKAASRKRKPRRPRATQTWSKWLKSRGLEELVELSDEVAGQTWDPTEADRKAAWELYTEMRTRISTQLLHYRARDEQAALDSLYKLFQSTRDLTREHGIETRHFATISVHVLNSKIRPFTSRWHRRLVDGKLETEDGRHLLREELSRLQTKLREFQRFLGLLAEGDSFQPGSESGLGEIDTKQHDDVGAPITFDRLLGLPTETSDSIVQAERADIAARRQKVNGQAADTELLTDLTGLAVSGGGIRSATFALGVLQGLVRSPLPKEYGQDDKEEPKQSDLLRDVDVLSTVSGGGYVGSFLSSFLNDTPAETTGDNEGKNEDSVGPRADQLPFRRRDKCESGSLRYLRNNSRYLISGGFVGRLTMVCQGLYGVVMNLLLLAILVFIAVAVTDYFPMANEMRETSAVFEADNEIQVSKSSSANQTQKSDSPTKRHGVPWTMSQTLAVVGTCWLALVILLPLVQKLGRSSEGMFRFQKLYGGLCVSGFAFVAVLFMADTVPAAHYGFLWAANELGFLKEKTPEFSWSAVWPALANIAAFLSARLALLDSHNAKVKGSSRKLTSVLRAAARLLLTLAGPVLIVTLYFLLCQVFLVTNPQHFSCLQIAFLGGAFLYAIGFVNVNSISPHCYYRNRLVETYLLKHEPDRDNSDSAYRVHHEDRQLLSKMGQSDKAPYHLINGSLNLPADDDPELRGRDSDFFLFSRRFCGSPILGYRPTTDWEKFDGNFDLGTAMAISGAAASPHMGTTTPQGTSFFLTLLNIRLGYWLRRPDALAFLPAWLARSIGGPGPSFLFREMFGRLRLTYRIANWTVPRVKVPYVNVSDGGHIENLGVYELLRRRCKFIIAIDGECDPELEFRSLMKLTQFAWIDFGVKIDMDVSERHSTKTVSAGRTSRWVRSNTPVEKITPVENRGCCCMSNCL